MSAKGWIIFIILAILCGWVGDMIYSWLPGVDNPFLATLLAAIVTFTPLYYIYNKYRRKIEA